MDHEKEYNDHFFTWKMPVYLCWGDHDVLIPMQTCRAIMNRYGIAEGQLHIFLEAAHAVNVEKPDEFVEYIRRIAVDRTTIINK
ncbi:MAG: alpha/beta hydrolase [Flavobacteriales bacterium]|nr:alpha/beta hydrolase [Flavobacteriales bacterium]